MAAKKHTFDIGTLSSAIDKIIVQGSKVFINFSGNEKTYEFSWKPANRQLLDKLTGFVFSARNYSFCEFRNFWPFSVPLVVSVYYTVVCTKSPFFKESL